MMQRVAIAGASGYTGRRLIAQLATNQDWRSRALVRAGSPTKTAFPADQDVAVCQLDNIESLAAALEGCDAIIQTIGTTKAQFAPGVNYETVDYGTTVALLAAAGRANVRRFLLLSSTGAGKPVGAYLRWKQRTEQVVIDSPLDWTILRPAAIVGPDRRALQIGSAPFTLLSQLPLVGDFGARLRAIEVDDLARCFIACLADSSTSKQILEGRSLWQKVSRTV